MREQPLHQLLGYRVCRIELEGEPCVGECLGMLAVAGEQLTQHAVDVRQIGLAAQGRPKRLNGSRPVTQQDQAVAEVMVRIGKIRFQFRGLAIPRRRATIISS